MKLDSKIKVVPKPKKSFGTLHLNSQDYPELKNMSIGDVKDCTITSEVVALRKPDHWDISEKGMKPGDVIATVEIRKINMPKKAHKKDNKTEDY